MIQAVFFDIDGTIVSGKTFQIPDSTKEALNKLKLKGIKTFVATGRPPFWMEFMDELDHTFDGYITNNGQHIMIDNQLIHKHVMDKNILEDFLNYTYEKQIACHIMLEDRMVLNLINDRVYDFYNTYKMDPIEDIMSKEDLLKQDIYQMCAFVNVDEQDELLKHLPGYHGATWNGINVDIISDSFGGKGEAIKLVAEHLEIDLNKTMAFGDGHNDVDMLQIVKIGVAMGDADDYVKQHADYVTDHAHENGIMNALKHFNILE